MQTVHAYIFCYDASGYGFKDPQAEMAYHMKLGVHGVFTELLDTGVAAFKSLTNASVSPISIDSAHGRYVGCVLVFNKMAQELRWYFPSLAVVELNERAGAYAPIGIKAYAASHIEFHHGIHRAASFKQFDARNHSVIQRHELFDA
ncbi:MAG: hypothetical protein EBT56_15895 [Betaproteobacteria bacterium]|nr:hypothetical protein [Betaproteobacteria bacterium]